MTTEQITCECGMIVMGIAENQLKSNLRVHKGGNKHKKLMKLKEEKKE